MHSFDRCTCTGCIGAGAKSFLNAKELKVHIRHRDDVLFC